MKSAVDNSRSGGFRRPRLQFTLRTLLVASILGATVLGLWVRSAHDQRRAVVAIESAGGLVLYDSDDQGWLHELLGRDYFDRVIGVDLSRRIREAPTVSHSDWPFREFASVDVRRGRKSKDSPNTASGPSSQTVTSTLRRSENVDLTPLASLRRLKYLNLAGMAVHDDDLQWLTLLVDLEQLNLSGTQVSDEAMPRISHLRNLELLDLSGTEVGSRGIGHLRVLISLTHLKLTRTKVDDGAIRHFSALRELQKLALGESMMSQADIERLRPQLPNAVITPLLIQATTKLSQKALIHYARRLEQEVRSADLKNDIIILGIPLMD